MAGLLLKGPQGGRLEKFGSALVEESDTTCLRASNYCEKAEKEAIFNQVRPSFFMSFMVCLLHWSWRDSQQPCSCSAEQAQWVKGKTKKKKTRPVCSLPCCLLSNLLPANLTEPLIIPAYTSLIFKKKIRGLAYTSETRMGNREFVIISCRCHTLAAW